MGSLIANIFNWLARTLNIPVGVVWLFFCAWAGWSLYDPMVLPFLGPAIFVAVYFFIWWVYGPKFWMFPKNFNDDS